uniref:OmpA family protein n=1 Tax=Roseivirga sp. TaxID=1964215 RepID=UPI00404794B4
MKYFLTIFLLSICLLTQSQEEENRLHSRNRKALELFKQAQEFDHVGNFFKSHDLLQEVLQRDDSFDEAVLLLHQVLIKRGEIEVALGVYEKYKSKVDQEFKNRMLADAAFFMFSNGEYERAKGLKDQIEGKVENVDEALFNLVASSIDYAIQQKAKTLDIEFERLPATLNKYPQQYFPSITASDKLVFTVRENQGRGDENLYFSQQTNGVWETPISISKKINSDRNEGTASISADGNTLVYTACNAPDGLGSCDLYVSYREGSDWTAPKNLGRAVNTMHWESQPSLSQDGRLLYFVSSRPNGMGGQDLWQSKKVNGKWAEAENLGESINTRFDDCSPYIHPNGVNLYFASRGRLGFGGYDLYTTENQNGKWTEVKNLGYPINNHRNQVGYTISLDGWAYYSDNQFNGASELFKFKLPKDLIPKNLVDYKRGLVLSAADSTPVLSEVFVADIQSDSIISRTYSDFESGRFNLVFPKESMANFYLRRRGYLLYKSNLKDLWQEKNDATIYLQPIKVGERIILNDILFDLNSAELSKSASKELEIAVEFLKDNPELVIEIGGHTDSIGAEDYNLNLSKLRAQSVYDFFISKNIPAVSLVYRGYGESQLLYNNVNSDEYSKNRRIELTILKLQKGSN